MSRRVDKVTNLAMSARRARTRNLMITRFFCVIVLIAAAFVGGFAARGNEDLLNALGMQQFTASKDSSTAKTTASTTYNSVAARISEVESVINDDSLDSYDLDATTGKVLDAFALSTQDSYLRYYDSSRYASMNNGSSATGGGIGVLFSEYNGSAYAVDVFEGSPAQQAGVQANDVIVAIDGDRAHQWTASEVASALKRDEGQQVVVTWRRGSTLDDTKGAEFTTTLTCTTATEQNVSSELSDEVGYIKIRQLTQNAATLVRQAVVDLDAQGAQSFVIDLRDNPGGYLTQAVDVSSLFVKSGTIVRIRTKATDETTKNASGDTVTDKPLVVLVNGNTASAAEVIAAALQDNTRATIVGEKTLGKGSVQVTHSLTFGGAIRYTAAYYKSPLDHSIDGYGINPDITVGVSGEDGQDAQKDFAIETAQSLVKD